MGTFLIQIKGLVETQTSEETYFLGAVLVVLTIIAAIFFFIWSKKPGRK